MIGKDVITFSIQTEVSLTHDKSKVTMGRNSTPNYNIFIPGSDLRQHRQRLEGALRNSGEGEDAEAEPVKRDEPVLEKTGGGQKERTVEIRRRKSSRSGRRLENLCSRNRKGSDISVLTQSVYDKMKYKVKVSKSSFILLLATVGYVSGVGKYRRLRKAERGKVQTGDGCSCRQPSLFTILHLFGAAETWPSPRPTDLVPRCDLQILYITKLLRQ